MIENYVLTDKQEEVYDKVCELSEQTDNGVIRASEIDADRTIDALVKSGLIYRENIRGVSFLSKYAITEKMIAELTKQVEPKTDSDQQAEDGESDEADDTDSVDEKVESADDEKTDTDLDESFFAQFKGIGDKTASKIIDKVETLGIESKAELLDSDLTQLPYVSDKRAETIEETLEEEVDGSLKNLDESIDKLKQLQKKGKV